MRLCSVTLKSSETLIYTCTWTINPTSPTILFLDIEVSCYGYEGIDAVKSSLKAGLAQSTEEMPIKINLIAPPQYVMTTTTLDRTEGIAKLNTAIQVIRESIEESEGHFNIKMEVSLPITDRSFP